MVPMEKMEKMAIMVLLELLEKREGGYVVPSVGSATTNENVTFYIHVENGYSFKSLDLNDQEVTSITYDDNGVGSYSTVMVENGYVVKANFVKAGGVVGNASYIEDGYIYSGATLDAAGNVISGGTKGEKLFESGNGKSEENPLTITSLEQLNNINDPDVIQTKATYFKLEDDISTDAVLPVTNRKNTIIDLNGNTLSSNVSSSLTLTDSSSLELSNGKVVIEGASSTANSNIVIQDGASLILNDVTYESNGTAAYVRGDSSLVEVNNSTIKGGAYAIGTNAGEVDNYGVEIKVKNSTLISETADKDNAGLLVNVPATVSIEKSIIKGQRQGAIIRGGDVTISNSDIVFNNEFVTNNPDKDNLYEEGNWGSGNETPSGALIVGNRSSSAYQYSTNLTLKNLNILEDIEDSSLFNTLAENEENTNSFWQLYAYGNSGEELGTTISVDSSTYNKLDQSRVSINDNVTLVLDDSEVKTGNVFVDGDYYANATYTIDEEGNITILSGEVTTEKMFDAGDGLSEKTPLLASDDRKVYSFISEDVLSCGVTYFKLTENANIVQYQENKWPNLSTFSFIPNPDGEDIGFKTNIDFGNNTLKFGPISELEPILKDNLNAYSEFVGFYIYPNRDFTFKNGTFDYDIGECKTSYSYFQIQDGSTLTLENMTIDIEGSGFKLFEGATLNLINCNITIHGESVFASDVDTDFNVDWVYNGALITDSYSSEHININLTNTSITKVSN